ncbi:cytosolic sulfotransferase 17-like, partial [Herrania umbratica]|uniref:Sulfotransferase n=1 Tax=Herrania umbratica TaxID=108875 RepID=A0A6J1BNV6_9ROSI
WLKALVFTIVNRTRFSLSDSPLHLGNPHKLVPPLDLRLYGQDQIPDLTSIPSPRLFGTHLAYAALAESIKQAKSRIVLMFLRYEQLKENPILQIKRIVEFIGFPFSHGHVEKVCQNKGKSVDEKAVVVEELQAEDEVLFMVKSSDNTEKNDTWFLDNGCSNHLIGCKDCL